MTREEREDALAIMNVIIHMIDEQYDNDRVEKAVDTAIAALKAEPCEDAVNREAVLDAIKNNYRMAAIDVIEKLPPVTPKQRWIPVSERLPKKTGLCLVSIGDLVTTASFDGHNFRTQTMVRFVPDAWMPLPEPWKGESE